MKPASVHDIKDELNNLDPVKVRDLCLRLARYKKENKELLTYLLFESYNEENYIEGIKEEIDQRFAETQKDNLYFATKSIRKTLRIANKYIKYSGEKKTEIEILVYFCKKLKFSSIRIYKSAALTNLYERQLHKIKTAVAKLHEDLQYDYQQELEQLSL